MACDEVDNRRHKDFVCTGHRTRQLVLDIRIRQAFRHMPCGTTNFILITISHYRFGVVRAVFAVMTFWSAAEFAVLVPLFVVLFYQELKRSVVESPIYQGLFPRGRYMRVNDQTEPIRDSIANRIFMRLGSWHSILRKRLGLLRMGLFRATPILEGRAGV